VVLVVLTAALYLIIAGWVALPSTALRAAALLSSSLGQEVTVGRLKLSGSILTAEGIVLRNPPGFGNGPLLKISTLTLAPDLAALLRGRRTFTLIRLEGAELDLRRDGRGTWNVNWLRRFAAGKPGGAEVILRRLHLRDSRLTVEGTPYSLPDLDLHDLATGGSLSSGITLLCRDPAGNPLSLTGTFRAGASPTADLTLSAPTFVPGALFPSLADRLQPLAGTRARLTAHLRFAQGTASLETALDLTGIALPGPGATLPASVRVKLSYVPAADRLSVTEARVSSGDWLQLTGTGQVAGLRSSRNFELELSAPQTDLARLLALIPPSRRLGVTASGTVGVGPLRIAGDRSGFRHAQGAITLRDIALSRDRQLLVAGLGGAARLAVRNGGLTLDGRISAERSRQLTLIRSVELPFQVTLPFLSMPLAVHLTGLHAETGFGSLGGDLHLQPGQTPAVKAQISFRADTPATLRRIFARTPLAVDQGGLAITLHAQGPALQEMRGELRATMNNLRSTLKGNPLAVDHGRVDTTLALAGRTASADGHVRVTGRYAGSALGGGCRVRLDGQRLELLAADLRYGQVQLEFPRLVAMLTGQSRDTPADYRSINVAVQDATLRYAHDLVGLASGNATLVLPRDNGPRRRGADGHLRINGLALRGHPLGSGEVAFRMDDAGFRAQATGTLLGGTFSADAARSPPDARAPLSLTLTFRDVEATGLPSLLPATLRFLPGKGRLGGTFTGRMMPEQGLTGTFRLTGDDLAVIRNGGRPVVSGLKLEATGSVAKEKVTLEKMTLQGSNGVVVSATGTAQDLGKPSRTLDLNLALAETPLNGILDQLVSFVPPALQESTAAGQASARATVALRGADALSVTGVLSLRNASLDLPGQKINISGATGAIPLSFRSPSPPEDKESTPAAITRARHASQLSALRTPASAQDHLTIDSVRLGAVALGTASFDLAADGSRLQILRCALGPFGGEIMGSGFLNLARGVYGTDLFIHDLSLRSLCDAFPNIKGYLSGRIDGYLALRGNKGGLAALSGILEFWARGDEREKMLVSREFLQKIAGKNLKGLFFQSDRPYDRGEILARLEEGFLTFDVLNISHTNLFGIRDLSVSVAEVQNRIALEHLLGAIRDAAARSKKPTGAGDATASPPETEFRWQE
jgi:hypothetical protein